MICLLLSLWSVVETVRVEHFNPLFEKVMVVVFIRFAGSVEDHGRHVDQFDFCNFVYHTEDSLTTTWVQDTVLGYCLRMELSWDTVQPWRLSTDTV